MAGGGQVCTYNDITERKRSEEGMAEKEAQLRSVLDNLSGGIRYVDRDRNNVFFNAQYCELYDFPGDLLKIGDSVRTENLYQAKRGDLGAGDADALADAWLEKLPVHVEPQSWERTTVHGRTLQVNSTPTPTGGIINIVTDITERKQLEEKLRQSHDLFSRAFQSNPNLMALVDSSTGEHVDVNEAFLDTLKFSREEVFGKTPLELNHWADIRDRDRILKEHSEHGRVRDFVGQLKAKDGTLVDCSFSTDPIKMDRLKLVLWTVIDITERKRGEEALRVATLEAEQSNKAKSDFLATMSHELRSPLNAIIGFSAMIRDQMFGPKKDDVYAEYGADIFNAGHHLLRLINDLLDLSKIEAGKLELNFENLDIEEAVMGSIRIIEPVAARSDVDVRAELDKNLPLLTADRRAFDQIVLNLLSNAIKFTPQGGRVSVRGSTNGKKTSLVIVDTGIGIKPDDIEKVLSPWGQITDPMTTDAKGSGLGLPIVKSLVELHGGKFALKSKVGKGTTVTVTLPNAGP